jgi:hypothetical protein
MVQNESPPCPPGFGNTLIFWTCNGHDFEECVHVGISESFLTAVFTVFVGFGHNNAFGTGGSEILSRSTAPRIFLPHLLFRQRTRQFPTQPFPILELT